MSSRTILLCALLACVPLSVAARQKPAMMFLGSTHLANHNRDLANTHVDDVRAPSRQREIQALVDRLAAWKPTHVAVEWPFRKQKALDERYAAYRAGTYELSADEVDQLGLRLAKQLGLARVDAVDWNEDAPGAPADYDFVAWARAHGKSAQYEAFATRWKDYAAGETRFLASHTVTQWYLRFNEPERMSEDGRSYFELISFGDDENNPGAAWVGQWYARNLRIFGHLRDLATRSSDRVLVIYGAGHGTLLRKDAVESGTFNLVDPRTVLVPAARS